VLLVNKSVISVWFFSQFPGDSVITGRLAINGRTCFVFSQVAKLFVMCCNVNDQTLFIMVFIYSTND